jgi:WXXGXW repeat (2 copies)
MKKKLIKSLFFLVIIFTVSFSASAQIYVKIRPVVPVVTVRPPQPSRNHVWIDEEWEPRGHGYKYSGGHWANPPHRGYTRRSGHWQHSRRGDVWVQGSWRRR